MHRISISAKDFKTMRPLHGQIIIKSSMDVSKTKGGLILDTSFLPEIHQEIFNVVAKLPRERIVKDMESIYNIEIDVGSEVLVNYFPILSSPVLDVGGEIFRIVPYNWIIMDIGKRRMLGDWLMVDKLRKLDKKSSELIATLGQDSEVSKTYFKTEQQRLAFIKNIEEKNKTSRVYFKVVMGWSGIFKYKKRHNGLLSPVEGDMVTLQDDSVIPLEDDLHLLFDGKKHYVTRAWKVLSIVEDENFINV